MASKFRSGSLFDKSGFLHSVDNHGRPIDPGVLEVANSIASRLISFAEGILRDPALATSLLEESAASVSRVVRERAQRMQSPITSIKSYLCRSYIRRVNAARRKEPLLSLATHGFPSDNAPYFANLELRVLASELMARCDATTREMLCQKLQGASWKDVGAEYRISAHAAEARFSYQLNKVRRELGLK